MLTVVVVALALLAGYAVVLVGLHLAYGGEEPVDEVHRVTAGGGWQVALHRIKPAAGRPRRKTPVVLAHGIAMCRRCWNLSRDVSLARYLSDRGHDVWMVEYRGYAASRHSGGPGAWDFAIDHHALEDAPALIDLVRRETGSEQVNWVGHSMGGIILYGYVQAYGTGHLARTVTIGSPARMGRVARHLRTVGWARKLLRPGWRFPLYAFTRLTLPFTVFLKSPILRTFYNPALVRQHEVAQLFTSGVQDLSNRALREIARWQTLGTMALEDGSTSIEEGLAALDVPFLVLAGAGDRLVPPRAALCAYDRSPAAEKAWRVFGGPDDPAPPLGHLDLIASAHAVRWVHPVIAEWLEKESRPGS